MLHTHEVTGSSPVVRTRNDRKSKDFRSFSMILATFLEPVFLSKFFGHRNSTFGIKIDHRTRRSVVVFCLSGCLSCPLAFCRKLRFLFLNEGFQLFLAFLAGMGVDVAAALFAIWSSRGIFAFPEVVAELTDAAGTLLPPLAFHRSKDRHILRRRFSSGRYNLFLLCNAAVNACRRLCPHIVGDMCVNVQRCCHGIVTDNRTLRMRG